MTLHDLHPVHPSDDRQEDTDTAILPIAQGRRIRVWSVIGAVLLILVIVILIYSVMQDHAMDVQTLIESAKP